VPPPSEPKLHIWEEMIHEFGDPFAPPISTGAHQAPDDSIGAHQAADDAPPQQSMWPELPRSGGPPRHAKQ
jgi:hypothetical protein